MVFSDMDEFRNALTNVVPVCNHYLNNDEIANTSNPTWLQGHCHSAGGLLQSGDDQGYTEMLLIPLQKKKKTANTYNIIIH